MTSKPSSNRVLAAPSFNQKSAATYQRTNAQIIVPEVDYRTHQFVPLEDASTVIFENVLFCLRLVLLRYLAKLIPNIIVCFYVYVCFMHV